MTKAWKSAAPTAVVSIVVPFLCGAAIAPWYAARIQPEDGTTMRIAQADEYLLGHSCAANEIGDRRRTCVACARRVHCTLNGHS